MIPDLKPVFSDCTCMTGVGDMGVVMVQGIDEDSSCNDTMDGTNLALIPSKEY
ncbi:hypothetical protein Pint_12879 [Pistacia integerrima]|uniref:Uncharacterized protein n=1 Tax=Pistacia integerrima TaxID=434235 RepID=A0ACC0YBK4_9ROSI|nr:hypothetical protein Pint_12879 [Pistacia integerrima]